MLQNVKYLGLNLHLDNYFCVTKYKIS